MEESEENGYLLSNFPEGVLDRILSFLELYDIIRLGVVNKRFRILCKDAPCYCFSQPKLLNSNSNCKCMKVIRYMNSLRHNRPYSDKIDRIYFSTCCLVRRHRRLHQQWILKQFDKFPIDELHVCCKLPSIFKHFDYFECLNVLKLDMTEPTLLKLFNEEIASLQHLYIKYIKVDQSIGDWISRNFPNLRHLVLKRIIPVEKKDLTIKSSCLEHLSLRRCCLFHPVRIITQNLKSFDCFIFEEFKQYKINDNFVYHLDAPNIQSFRWKGYLRKLRYDAQMFRNLQVAIIPLIYIPLSNKTEQFMPLFLAIRFARRLHIDSQVLKYWGQILRKHMDLFKSTCISYNNLLHGEIHVTCSCEWEDYRAIVYSPTVTYSSAWCTDLDEKSVRIGFKEYLKNYKKDEVKKTRGLKKVKVVVREFYFSIIMIGLLMKSCVDLEEITLNYPSCFHKSMMRDGVRYLEQFQRASSTPPLFHFLP